VNLGGGDCRDVELLAKGIADRVQRTQGIDLNLRIPLIGA